MSFGGSVSAMISSLKNNKLGKRKFGNGSGEMDSSPLRKGLKYENKMSPEEFQVFQSNLRKKRKQRDIVYVVLGVTACLLTVFALIYFFN